jgi:hypothetical protein
MRIEARCGREALLEISSTASWLGLRTSILEKPLILQRGKTRKRKGPSRRNSARRAEFGPGTEKNGRLRQPCGFGCVHGTITRRAKDAVDHGS